MVHMTDNSKSRRQILRQLVHLDLIGSAKELKKKGSVSAWISRIYNTLHNIPVCLKPFTVMLITYLLRKIKCVTKKCLYPQNSVLT